MATQIQGDNVIVPGQVSVSGAPTNLLHVPTVRYARGLRAVVALLDLNAAAPIDLTPLTVSSSKFVPTRCLVFNPTANLSSATLGLYTAPAAGGTAIVTPTLLASLTGTDTFQQLTIAALTSVIKVSVLYPRLTVAAGTAGTVALLLEIADLGLF